MAKGFLTNIDLNKNQLLEAVLEKLSSAPGSPVSGQMYYNTTDNKPYAYNGTSWVQMAAGTVAEPALAKLYAYQNLS